MTTRELFARLLKCEAGGEGEDGMKAVATVIMNRVNVSGGQYLRENQGSLRNVIQQPGEFTCMMSDVYGEPNPQTVWSNPPEDIHYHIADWALSGNKLSGAGECLWYYNPFAPDCASYFPRNGSGVIFNRINQHCFYNPTSLYYQT
ncbi:MAG: cell wall hydrolase [Bacillota bacterium]|nr:cell wall hydrolase [Bacillota bacterium]